MIIDYDGIVYKKSTELINGNYSLNSDAFKINNLKPEIIKKLGLEPEEAYQKVVYDLKYCNLIVAHNLDFDYPILKNEFNNYNVNFDLSKLKKFCTMKWGHNELKKKFHSDPKYPKLTELYEYLFNHTIRQYHNSNSDVVILSKIVKEILFIEKSQK